MIATELTETELIGTGAPAKNPAAPVMVGRQIRAEYLEMPGLILTLPQAMRLWNLPAAQADRALSDLVGDGFLIRDARGRYRRRGCPRCS